MSDGTVGSNRLAVLAAEIMEAHEAIKAAKLTSLERAKEAGAKLREAKKRVGDRKWLRWLESIGLPDRTARNYMQIAKLPPDTLADLADVTFSAALEAIRAPNADANGDRIVTDWTDSQLERKGRVEAGESVVASMRDDGNGQRIDEALLNWAENEGRLLRIDRQGPYGNPFVMPDDGDRDEVIAKFEKFYWPHKPELLRQVPEHAGKVLACWCYPERCHGHVIAETINRVIAGEGTAEEIAEEIANHDG
jgi:hypothetical protein